MTPTGDVVSTRTPRDADARPAVSVEELKRAWSAVQAGQFKAHVSPAQALTPGGPTSAIVDGAARWTPAAGERVLPVVGCAGSVGATTVALAVALAAHTPARVVECCTATASGLAAASTAELGVHESGWRQGRHGEVLLERADGVRADIGDVPLPTVPATVPAAAVDADGSGALLTVLDVGWELGLALMAPSWLHRALREAPGVVAVTTATVPGVRRLETAAELLGGHRVTAAVLGPPRRKWPRGVESSAGGNVRGLLAAGRVVEIPHARDLAVAGLTTSPLPDRLLAAAARLLATATTVD